MSDEDWRVEVQLDDEHHGYSLGERLRALDLDDEARKRLGRRVVVTRSGSRLFLYTRTEDEAVEAVRVLATLVDDDNLTAEISITRWHPIEAAWKDAALLVPRTDAERAHERERREALAYREAVATGHYDWHVHVGAADRDQAAGLEERLRARDLQVRRRWRYLTIDVPTDEEARHLASRIYAEAPDVEIAIEASLELPPPLFVLIQSWL